MLDAISAQHLSMSANINRNDKERSEPFRPKEFLLFTQPASDDKKDVSAVRLKAFLDALATKK